MLRLVDHISKKEGVDGASYLFDGIYPGRKLFVIASNGMQWEHVSVSVRIHKHGIYPKRTELRVPIWNEMCFIKDTFWEASDSVYQIHPPLDKYVNNYDCLHLWRPIGFDIPMPPLILV